MYKKFFYFIIFAVSAIYSVTFFIPLAVPFLFTQPGFSLLLIGTGLVLLIMKYVGNLGEDERKKEKYAGEILYKLFFYAIILCLFPFLAYILMTDLFTMETEKAKVLAGYFVAMLALLGGIIQTLKKL